MSDWKCYLSLVVVQHSICTTAHSYVLHTGIYVDTFQACMPSDSTRDDGVPTPWSPTLPCPLALVSVCCGEEYTR